MKTFLSYIFVFHVIFSIYHSQYIYAQEINKESVLTVTNNFINSRLKSDNKLGKTVSSNIESISEINNQSINKTIAFVVNLKPTGFLILSNNTKIQPIIAYSFNHSWDYDTSSSNIFLQILTTDLSNRLEHLDEIPIEIQEKNKNLWDYYQAGNNSNDYQQDFRQWPKVGTTTTGGWIETTWHQTEPYNQFCPIDPTTSERSVIGCGALAVAQIVNYHQYFNNKRFTVDDKYYSENSTISIDADSSTFDFPSFKELNRRLDTLQYKYDNNLPLNDRDYAALCFACGIMTNNEYSSIETPTVSSELHKAFSIDMLYSSADISSVTDDFYSILIDNMKNGLPAELSFWSAIGGHAAVCDGYNTDDFYHINFGWGANSPTTITDCWYDLSEELPYKFSIFNAIVNIKPGIEENTFLTVPDSLIKFEPSLVNTSSEAKVIKLRNEGNSVINIEEIVIPNNFSASLDRTNYYNRISQFTLNPKSEIPLYIYCKPDSIGRFDGEIEIVLTDGKLKRYKSIKLLGYGRPENGTLITDKFISGTWDSTASPYIIIDNVSVEPGKNLTLMPGTEVKLLNNCDFTIGEDAQFIAKGTETDSIYFTSLNPSHSCNGLKFNSSGDDDTLSYCVFEKMGNESANGGAINIYSTDLFIVNSGFTNNVAKNGGAIYLDNSESIIINNIFLANQAGTGGVIYSLHSNVSFQKNRFTTNQAEYGGVIYSAYSNISIKNCILDSNIADNSGSILECRNSEILIQNITAVNFTLIKFEDFFGLKRNNNVEIKNSIFWNRNTSKNNSLNKPKSVNYNLVDLESDTIYFHFNDCDSSFTSILKNTSNITVTWGPKNISEDPQFIDFENKDYRLLESSPCVDAGDPEDDVGDEPFPHAFLRNIGAYGGTSEACITRDLKLTVDPNKIDFGEQTGSTDTSKQIITLSLKNGCLEDINIANMFIVDTTFINFSDFSSQNNSFVLRPGDIREFRVKLNYSLINESMFGTYNTEIIIKTIELTETTIPITAEIYGTILQGEISGVLDKEKNPYQVISSISIEEGKSLLIKPGVKIVFSEGTNFYIGGNSQLRAIGTEKDSIFFIAPDSYVRNNIEVSSSGNDDTLQYCVLRGIETAFFMRSSPTISNCLFMNNGNLNTYRGVIEFLYCDNFEISDCRFENNYSDERILSSYGSNGIIKNTIFYNNIGNCIEISGDSDIYKVELVNLALVKNSSDNTLISLSNNDTSADLAVINNSIIGGNLNPSGAILEINSAKVTVEYSNIDTTADNWIRRTKGNTSPLGELFWGDGNIFTYPMFIDTANGDLTLQENSPCIDTGNPEEIHYDFEDPSNPGYALLPAMGTLRNDMGAYGGGGYTITSVKDLQENDEIPTSFSLSQNYPNPFNPSTTIKYSIPSRTVMLNSFQHLNNEIPDPSSAGRQARNDNAFVQLKIYDLLGREVTTLVNEQQKAGYYEVSWNAANNSSGVYFYRLKAGEFVNTKKMLLLQ